MRNWFACFALLLLSVSDTAFAQQLPPEATPSAPPAAAKATEAPPPPTATETTKDTAAAEEEEEDQRAHMYSFGDAPASLMFTPEQVSAMKNVLISVEAQQNASKSSGSSEVIANQDILPFLAASKPTISGEPATYPVFYLSSIFYHSPSDWTVWVNAQRIAPKNNKPPLEVIAISEDTVNFRWKPDYMTSLVRRQQEKKFASVASMKNRLTAKETVAVDKGSITFTLHPNQTFAAAYMSTFEGKVQPVELPSLDAVAVAGTSNGTASKTSDDAKAMLNDMAGGEPAPVSPPPAPPMAGNMIDANTMSTLQELIKNQKNFTAATPRNTPPARPEAP